MSAWDEVNTTTGKVKERLCGLAGLAVQEHVQVSRAYLTTPALVGRDNALVRVRRKILSLMRREGSTVLIEGVDGVGRSRMLDACVLEGKLLGLSVLRADAGDSAGGDWSAARAVSNQLVALMPREAADATRLSRDVTNGARTFPPRRLLQELARELLEHGDVSIAGAATATNNDHS